ncbi:MAG: hypothetical protein GFH25_541218n27 [Chloroflexi bacterium AL-N10]|nr:hypothetical protein [Chloroflexi bacterium AL-N1]NOK69889.1 hypothetical protein [Chloroflexi bacterium AL-N10]NOK73814.1 hypothetical protein [Chloroflexi bacterium AL-N5]NOK91622.1 hypothetical protein [Chloroflexi bacterium AL-N15]
MNKQQIIIVTQQNDPHADDVIMKLRELDHEPIRLNTDDVPIHTLLTFGISNQTKSWNGAITIQTNGRVIEPDHIQSIWWRRPGAFALPKELSARERIFAQSEIEQVLMGLWASVDCYWMSHPDHIRHASWKEHQLQRAAQIGFDIPRTLITNDAAEARDFYEICQEQMIYKVLSDPYLGARELALQGVDESVEAIATSTTLISEEELTYLDTIRLAPCQFQEYIPKKTELRVTVIGDTVFAVEIDSQAHEESRIDWRALPPEDLSWRQVHLPSALVDKCLAFVHNYHLNYSAMDFIVTPDDRYVFLENNPNGQFIWVEMLVPELPMIDTLAHCLIRGANR